MRVDDETLALDDIAEIGPGNSFLIYNHTFKRLKEQARSVDFNLHSAIHGWI